MTLPLERLPTIAARRVRLRWMTRSDVEALYRIFSDERVTRYWSSPPLADRQAAEDLLDEIRTLFREGTLYQWGVALRGVDLVIGTCTLADLDIENGRAEIGFALAGDRWGKGLMSEAVRALIEHAFGPLGLRRLEADVDPRNAASIRLLERMGFRREGYLRERWNVGGELQDSVFYGLLAREWRAAAPDEHEHEDEDKHEHERERERGAEPQEGSR